MLYLPKSEYVFTDTSFLAAEARYRRLSGILVNGALTSIAHRSIGSRVGGHDPNRRHGPVQRDRMATVQSLLAGPRQPLLQPATLRLDPGRLAQAEHVDEIGERFIPRAH